MDAQPPRLAEQLAVVTPTALRDGADVADERWSRAELAGAEAEAVRLRGCALEQVDLDGARLRGLELRDVRITNSSLANLMALRADLVRVELRECRLTGLELAEAGGGDLLVQDCRADLLGLRYASLTRATFRGCVLTGADFSRADLRGARFEDCDLAGADVSGARLERAILSGCRLEGLRGVEALRGVRMPWPEIVEIAGALAAHMGIAVLGDEDGA